MDLALPLTDCQTYFLFEFESEFGKISTHSMSIPSCTILENSENSDAPQLKFWKIVKIVTHLNLNRVG